MIDVVPVFLLNPSDTEPRREDPVKIDLTITQALPEEQHFFDASNNHGPEYVKTWDSYVGQEPMKAQLRIHIDATIKSWGVLPHVLLASGMPGVGKGHDLDTLILTPSGWSRMGDLELGDEVIGSNGTATAVTNIYDRGVLPLFRVTFSDGSSTRCDPDHLWQVQTPKQRYKNTWKTIDTKTLSAGALLDKNGRSRFYIPMTAPVEHNVVLLPVEPYLAGVMLGNADFKKGVISLNKNDRDIADRIVTDLIEYPTTTALRFRPLKANELIDALGQRGASASDKYIPTIYLTADLEARRSLLAGLLDTDGGVRSKRGSAQFHSTSLALAGGVRTLVESLGGTARVRVLNRGEIRVDININENPFRGNRKAEQWKMPTRGPSRSIVKIEPDGHADIRCIRVAAIDHLYVTERYVVTHNTTLARLIAKEMGGRLTMMVPPFSKTALHEAAMQMNDGGFLFIDEIHKLADNGPAAAENLLHMLEERVIYLEDGPHELAEFTIIGATTDADKLPETIIDRFEIKPFFQPYSLSELVRITKNFTDFFGTKMTAQTMVAIAKACRSTPRIARELVIAVRDVQIATEQWCTPEKLYAFKEIEPDGTTRQHKAYLKAMYQFFGREESDGSWSYTAGEASLMSILRENKQGIYRLERFLIEKGLLDRTPRGRRLTPGGIKKAREYANKEGRLATG